MTESQGVAPAIEVRGLGRNFGATKALKDVSLTIKPHTICGLLGSNGAGKTTLMSLIAGHDRQNSGSIRVLGEPPFESEHVAAATSFIRDNQRYPDEFVLKHVLATAKLFHPNWDAALAAKLVDQFGLPAKTEVRKFSRGQLSAIAIIVGLASRAPITIFDEPYLGLDISARRRFYELLIEDFTEHPRTIIISTHLIEEMEAMFDQVVVLHRGELVLDASPDQLAETAFEISGKAEAVSVFTTGLNVISSRRVGSLASAVVLGKLDHETLAHAESVGLSLQPAAIHDLVAAIGNSYEAEEESA